MAQPDYAEKLRLVKERQAIEKDILGSSHSIENWRDPRMLVSMGDSECIHQIAKAKLRKQHLEERLEVVKEQLLQWERANQKPTIAPFSRARSSIESLSAARRLDAYLKAHPERSLESFAKNAETTPRTLYNFRKTGKVRRKIFSRIADQMGEDSSKLLDY